ncbi:hypothetical protein [Streptomyces synnematoformans]
MGLLRRIGPDVVLLSGSKLAETGQIDLGMPGAVSAPSGEDGEERDRTAVGVAINPEVFSAAGAAETRSRAWWDNPVRMPVELNIAPGAGELHVVSFSMCQHAAGWREGEAGWLTGLVRDGAVILAGGPTASYPQQRDHKIMLPDFSTSGDAVQRAHRTRTDGLGWWADTVPDAVLAGGDPAVYQDLARYAARHCKLPDAVDPTVAANAVRDAGQRTTRVYGSGGVAGAVHSVVLLPETDTRRISPHRLVITRLHLDRLVRLLSERSPTPAV